MTQTFHSLLQDIVDGKEADDDALDEYTAGSTGPSDWR